LYIQEALLAYLLTLINRLECDNVNKFGQNEISIELLF